MSEHNEELHQEFSQLANFANACVSKAAIQFIVPCLLKWNSSQRMSAVRLAVKAK